MIKRNEKDSGKNTRTKYSCREEDEMEGWNREKRSRQKDSVFEDPINQPRLPSQKLGWENFSTPGKRLGHPQDAHPFFLSTDRQHKKQLPATAVSDTVSSSSRWLSDASRDCHLADDPCGGCYDSTKSSSMFSLCFSKNLGNYTKC